jgi:CelD/BcsL family acetyltransferase involved in cellulose biosynthesis
MSSVETTYSKEMTDSKGVAGWTPTTTSLRYSLSYLRLFELSFKALVDPQRFDPDGLKATDVEPPVNEVPVGYDVVVQRHQLLTTPIPVIQRLPRMIRYAPRQLLHFYTDLRGGADQAFKRMSSKTRSTVMRKVRSYREFCGGEIRWSTYKTIEEMPIFSRLARQVASNTYQERLFGAGLPNTEEFNRQMLELARRDSVRAFLLFHDERPVAYLYLPSADGMLIYDYLGYDPEYIDHSPGTVLQYLALEALYAEQRFPLYYWGFGYSQTKKIFSTGQVLGADVYYFKPTVRNQLAVRLHHSTDCFSEYLGRGLEKLNVKQTLKGWLKKW